MKLSDFKYTLPEKLIAQYPVEPRDSSRLMVINRKEKTIENRVFGNVIDYLHDGDCLVINVTKVFPARLIGIKEKTDAEVEIFLLRELENNLWEVLVKPARKVRIGNRLVVNGSIMCDVLDNTVSGGRVVRFDYEGDFYEIIEKIGRSRNPSIKNATRLFTRRCAARSPLPRRGSILPASCLTKSGKRTLKSCRLSSMSVWGRSVPFRLRI